MSNWVRNTDDEQSDHIVLSFKNPETREGKYIAELEDGSFSVQYWPDLAKEIETVSLLGSGETKEEAARVLAEHLSGYTEEDLVQLV
jgi:hypothetical protein